MVKRKIISVKKRAGWLLLLSLLGFFLCVIGYVLDYGISNIAAGYVLLISIAIIYFVRENYLLAILFSVVAYCNYSVVVAEYLSIIKDTLFTIYAGTNVANRGIYVLLIFMATVGICVSVVDIPKIQKISSEDMVCDKTSRNLYIIVAAIEVLLIYILIFAFGRPNQLGDRGSPTALYEYSILLFILCFYYGGKNELCKITTLIILGLFVIQNFMFGGRITGLQLLIVAYVMMFEKKINLNKALPLIVIGFLALSVIGVERGNILSGDFDISNVVEQLCEKKFTLDTAYSSYHTSLTFILSENNTSYETRLMIFWGFIKSIFFGKYDTVNSNVSSYTRQLYHHYGGGFLPFFFEFYLGIVGIFLIAFYLMLFIKEIASVSNNSSGLKKCIAVYVVASTFRWYIYSPIQITRGVLLLIVCYKLIDKVLRGGGTRK